MFYACVYAGLSSRVLIHEFVMECNESWMWVDVPDSMLKIHLCSFTSAIFFSILAPLSVMLSLQASLLSFCVSATHSVKANLTFWSSLLLCETRDLTEQITDWTWLASIGPQHFFFKINEQSFSSSERIGCSTDLAGCFNRCHGHSLGLLPTSHLHLFTCSHPHC